MNFSSTRNVILVGFCLFISILIGVWKISLPGAHYDELLFVDAASSINPTLFINKSFFGLPLLLMGYIGALKAWIYTPIFQLFDVSIVSIRLPMVLLGTITLIIYYKILLEFITNKSLLFLCFLILCSDPSFNFVNRIDWGPNAIAHLLIAIFLWQFTKYLKTGSPVTLIWLVLVSLIGIFDKLNFLWFIIGAIASSLLIFRKQIWRNIYKNPKTNLLIFWLILIIGYFSSIYWILPATQSVEGGKSFDVWQKAQLAYSLIPNVISAESIFGMVFGKPYPISIKIFFPILFFFLLISFFIKKNSNVKFAYFCLLISVLIIVQIWLTRSAGGPHHYLLQWPLIWIFIFIIASEILIFYRQLKVPTYLLITIFLFFNLLHSFFFLHQIYRGDSWRQIWSPAIYELVEYLKDNPSSEVYCIDWGIGTQVKAFLSPFAPNTTIHDFWPSFWKDPKVSKPKDFKLLIKNKSSDLTKIKLIEFIPEKGGRAQIPINRKKLIKSLVKYQAFRHEIRFGSSGYLIHWFKKK